MSLRFLKPLVIIGLAFGSTAAFAAAQQPQAAPQQVAPVLNQDYPRELFRIIVIADNCSDKTAELARQAGAEVWERSHQTRRTKGYAPPWAIDRLVEEHAVLDAFCIFDADNLVERTFLACMNDCIEAGESVVQIYCDTKNPTDSWVSRSMARANWVTNRV